MGWTIFWTCMVVSVTITWGAACNSGSSRSGGKMQSIRSGRDYSKFQNGVKVDVNCQKFSKKYCQWDGIAESYQKFSIMPMIWNLFKMAEKCAKCVKCSNPGMNPTGEDGPMFSEINKQDICKSQRLVKEAIQDCLMREKYWKKKNQTIMFHMSFLYKIPMLIFRGNKWFLNKRKDSKGKMFKNSRLESHW